MQRSRLRNIINLSKGLSNKKESVGDPYDEFIKTLPKELLQDANYRMQAAWKAYGSPKDYKQALWEGMIQPIDENTYKLPSIGYNEETDEYEYLNKGRENETVAKDIRVWDNDVIPFVQELKHGGYVRTFNEAKDCWTYSKNSQKEDTLDKEQINIQKEQSGESVDSKGIPVVDNKGEQQAEIERNEIIFRKEVTDKIEELFKKYKEEDSKDKKDSIAIEMGKILTCEITKHTEDRTGLIEEVEQKM